MSPLERVLCRPRGPLTVWATWTVGHSTSNALESSTSCPKPFPGGYQTQCIGKMHVHPARKRLVLIYVTLHDGYLHVDRHYDGAYGASLNSPVTISNSSRPSWGRKPISWMTASIVIPGWPGLAYAEALHPTNWLVTEAIEFSHQGSNRAFFLKLSLRSHIRLLIRSQYYFDMYSSTSGQDWDYLGDWEQLRMLSPSI